MKSRAFRSAVTFFFLCPLAGFAHTGLGLAQPMYYRAGSPPPMEIVLGPASPGHVSGSIVFAVRHADPSVREVVFLIDGARRWTARRVPFRFLGTGWLNTRGLSNGRHVLSVLVVYRSHRHRLLRRAIRVANRAAARPAAVSHPHGGARPPAAASQPQPPNPPPPSPPPPLPPPPPPVTPSPAPVAFFNRETYMFSTALPMAQEAARYSAMVLQSTDGVYVPQLHAGNPKLKVFMYMDPMDSSVNDPTAMTMCTSYSADAASQPSWFLLDQNGNQLLYSANVANHIMDVGDPAYQQACVARATALAKQYGFDGIFWDDIETQYGWVFQPGLYSAKYPTVSGYYGSFLSFVSYAGPALRAHGLLSLGNISAATTPEWQQLNTPLDGAEEESFTDGGSGLAQQIPFFAQKLANVTWSEANGKVALLHSYNATEAGNTFGLASMLLVANGNSSYSTSQGNYTTSEVWYPEYTTAGQLGGPTAGATQFTGGGYERPFQNGIVVVNPTAQTLTLPLPAGTYSGSNLTASGTVTLPATSGAIMLRTG